MFDVAYNQTRKFEGGYSNNKNDRGGATIFGISSKYWPQDFATVKSLVESGRTKEAEDYTKNFYKKNFWDASGAEKAPPEMQPLLFDAAVNHGVGTAKKMLASSSSPNQFLDQRQDYMNNIVKNDPSQAVFQKGWTNRVQAQKAPTGLTPEEEAELSQLEAEFGQKIPKNNALTPEEEVELAQLESEFANTGQSSQKVELSPAERFQNESPLLRTVGRGARSVASGLASAADLALLAPKTAALGAGLVAENMGATEMGRKLQRFGTIPTLADSTKALIDQNTGDKLKPTGFWDGVGDFAGEVVSSVAPFSKADDALAVMKSPTAKDAVSAVLNPQGMFFNKRPPSVPSGTEAIRQAKSNKYAEARKIGASFSDDIKTQLAKEIENQRYTDPLAKGMFGDDAIDELARGLQDSSQYKMNLDSFEAIDKRLGSKGSIAFKGGDNDLTRRIDNVQSALRDLATDPKFIEGTDEGINTYRDATKLAALNFKADDIDQALERAKTYVGGEGAGIRSEFARLSKSKKFAKYTPEEQKIINKIARTGKLDGLMGALSSRLFSIGGGVKGGPVGAAIGFGVNEAARSGQSAIKTGQAKKLADLLMKQAAEIDPSLANDLTRQLLTTRGSLAAVGAVNNVGQNLLPKPYPRLMPPQNNELARLLAQTK
ncbi:Protein of unknown function DUF847 [uncultured Caudovirales phage]|uniref:TtsA-like Glycoside hydrolase family 108 domain-containing protein n=1 Tax=uncultured Caudovirales phage TaxID=2100421 RepID=A0A6J5LZK4_9CAUD|nr:Protein of unknown function DUF847 [uncultured Caudovirales phage]